MTLDEKKEFVVVVSIVVAVSVAVLISMIHKFNICDLVYFMVCIGSLMKYIFIKLKK